MGRKIGFENLKNIEIIFVENGVTKSGQIEFDKKLLNKFADILASDLLLYYVKNGGDIKRLNHDSIYTLSPTDSASKSLDA